MNPFDGLFLQMCGVSAASASFLLFFFWLLQTKTNNAGSVDLGWCLSLLAACLAAFFLGAGIFERKALILFMVLAWSMRLSFLLIHRLLYSADEDPRYAGIRRNWGVKANQNFFYFFQFQAGVAVLLALPFYLSAQNSQPLSGWEMAGFLIWLTGFIGETLSDHQLTVFKRVLANQGKPCDQGLWKYSRHPNYFFEWIVWIGYFVYACGSSWGWVSIFSPLLMLHFLVNVSGIPPAEAQALKTKGQAYCDYQKRTSPFIPWRQRT